MGAQHNEWYAARSMVALADGGDVVEMDDVLMARARSIRDTHYGPRITYSPLLSSPERCGHVFTRAVLVLSQPRF